MDGPYNRWTIFVCLVKQTFNIVDLVNQWRDECECVSTFMRRVSGCRLENKRWGFARIWCEGQYENTGSLGTTPGPNFLLEVLWASWLRPLWLRNSGGVTAFICQLTSLDGSYTHRLDGWACGVKMSRIRTNGRGDSSRLKWKGIRGWATLKEPLSDAGNSLLTLGPCIGRLNGFSQPY